MQRLSGIFALFIVAAALAAFVHWVMPSSWKDVGAVLAGVIVLAIGFMMPPPPQPYNNPKFWE